eukprot:4272102-Amphidinium_carterae.2
MSISSTDHHTQAVVLAACIPIPLGVSPRGVLPAWASRPVCRAACCHTCRDPLPFLISGVPPCSRTAGRAACGGVPP